MTRDECLEELLDLITELDKAKVISRLKCERWVPPSYYSRRSPPLIPSLQTVVNEKSCVDTSHQDRFQSVTRSLENLSQLVTKFDNSQLEDGNEDLKAVLCAAGRIVAYDSSLEQFFKSIDIRLNTGDEKVIRAFDKLANYWRVCIRLSRAASKTRFRTLFETIRIEFLEPYTERVVNGTTRFVHAEVQLATYHRQGKTSPRPRVMGTSKAACYLCDLFLSRHSQYSISATHGMLFEQWTIPDLATYSEDDRQELRKIIRYMRDHLSAWARPRKRWVPFPVQSGIYHPPYLQSQAGTVTTFSRCSSQNPSIVTIEQSSEKLPSLGMPYRQSTKLSLVKEKMVHDAQEATSRPEYDPPPSPIPPKSTMPNCAEHGVDGVLEAERASPTVSNFNREELKSHGIDASSDLASGTKNILNAPALLNKGVEVCSTVGPPHQPKLESRNRGNLHRRSRPSRQYKTHRKRRTEQTRPGPTAIKGKRNFKRMSYGTSTKVSRRTGKHKKRKERRREPRNHHGLHEQNRVSPSFAVRLFDSIAQLFCCLCWSREKPRGKPRRDR
jgi:hypothetical protein